MELTPLEEYPDPSQISATPHELVARMPFQAQVLDRWEIAYCCGQGHRELGQVCAERGFDIGVLWREMYDHQVQRDLDRLERGYSPADLAPDQLAERISSRQQGIRYHDLPCLGLLFKRVTNRHGELYPEFFQLELTVEELGELLVEHFRRDENELFPALRYHLGLSDPTTPPAVAAGDLLPAMAGEHGAIIRLVQRMRELTGDFTPPPNACNTYRVVLDALEEMTARIEHCLREEENLLWPAIEGVTAVPAL